MRMRENQVYFRWTAGRDVVDDGTIADLVDSLEMEMGVPFARWRLLGQPDEARAWDGSARHDVLDSRIGVGTNQQLRIRWTAPENPAGIVSLEVQANMHPYTGRYVTSIDLRVGAAVMSEATRRESWRARFVEWVHDMDALYGHAHDVDDDAIQNAFDPGLLLRGYGVVVEEGVDLADNPGREVSRGEFRYVVNWLSYFGAEMCETLNMASREFAIDGLGVNPVEGGIWFELGASPLDSDAPEQRARQRALRDGLELRALADRTRRTFGFWQRR